MLTSEKTRNIENLSYSHLCTFLQTNKNNLKYMMSYIDYS